MKNKIGLLVMKRQNNILDDQQTVALLQNIRKCLPEEMLVQINERYEKANIAGNHCYCYSYVKAKINAKAISLPYGFLGNPSCCSHRAATKIEEKFHTERKRNFSLVFVTEIRHLPKLGIGHDRYMISSRTRRGRQPYKMSTDHFHVYLL